MLNLTELMVVFCYYFFYEKAESMGCWDEYQQPAQTIETIRKELSMTTVPSGAWALILLIFIKDFLYYFSHVRALVIDYFYMKRGLTIINICLESGVPQEHIEFHRKNDLALQ